MEEFKKRIESFFGNLPAQLPVVADLFFMEGINDTALQYLEDYESAVGSMPQHILFFKCKCLINLNKYDMCIQQLNRLKPEDGYYFEGSMMKVLCYIITGRQDKALEMIVLFEKDFEKLSPNNRIRLNVYEMLLNISAGREKASSIKGKLGPVEIGVFYEIAQTLLSCKEKYTLELVLEILKVSDDISIPFNLGRIFYKYGCKQEAKAELIRAIKHDVMDKETFRILEEIS